MSYFGIFFDTILIVLGAFALGIVIPLLLFSERFRRKVVFINKQFYNYREAWLKFTARLSSCKSKTDVYHVILTTYIEVFGLVSASLFLHDEQRKRYVHGANLMMPPGEAVLCASPELISYFRNRNRVFNSSDGEYIPTAEEAAFVNAIGAKFLVPLMNNGAVEGIVAFNKKNSGEQYVYEDYDLMKILGKQAALALSNFRLSHELIEARELAVIAKMSSFVVHDVKNHLSTLSMIIENADEHIANPDFQKDMLNSIQKSIGRMQRLVQRLRSSPWKDTVNTSVVDISALTRGCVNELLVGNRDVEIEYYGEPVMAEANAEELNKVIFNLLLNALDACANNAAIKASSSTDGIRAYLRIEDNGCGISEEFIRDHLFKPFRSTKRVGLGIGLYQCKQIVEAHGGTISVESEIGKGTAFILSLPLAAERRCIQYSISFDELRAKSSGYTRDG
jgi:putative PEP-CTERM system histidine kinase